MPQINRIRVNNVKYNFGTQYYDDFMMRFHCRNTIYDLANGGGKSLLMLLLLQNMIPNCTLDEKQPVEKLFRPGGGNTVIHSLIEWKLDATNNDGYKYMTTGFCARKARIRKQTARKRTAYPGVFLRQKKHRRDVTMPAWNILTTVFFTGSLVKTILKICR